MFPRFGFPIWYCWQRELGFMEEERLFSYLEWERCLQIFGTPNSIMSNMPLGGWDWRKLWFSTVPMETLMGGPVWCSKLSKHSWGVEFFHSEEIILTVTAWKQHVKFLMTGWEAQQSYCVPTHHIASEFPKWLIEENTCSRGEANNQAQRAPTLQFLNDC